MVITIKDVARMAGVSVSTVSRVLNHSKPVSDEIRKRVEKVVEETGYVPNPVARSLVITGAGGPPPISRIRAVSCPSRS